MLPPTVYQKIYETGRTGGVIVEVGTALGAATVALAMGLKDSGSAGHVYSFDPMTGGPRRSISTASDRLARVQANLAHYGVLDRATVVPLALADGIAALPEGANIDVLMLDADGRIDRDLILLKERMAPGCLLIIDDVADKVRVKPRGNVYSVDSKMRLSYLLVEFLKRGNVITTGQQLKDTYFGVWQGDAHGILTASPLLDVYRELTFQKSSRNRSAQLRAFLVRHLTQLAPNVAAIGRRRYRERKYGMPA